MSLCVTLGILFIVLFGVLLSYQLKIWTTLRSLLSNTAVLQQKASSTSFLSEQSKFYTSFKEKCETTILLGCAGFLFFLGYTMLGLIDHSRCTVTYMTQIAFVLGLFLFFFTFKFLRYNDYPTNLRSESIAVLSISGVILAISLGVVLRYGQIKEWSILQFILNPDWFGKIKSKLRKT